MFLPRLSSHLVVTFSLCLLTSCSEGLSDVSPTQQKISEPLWTWVSGSDTTNQIGNYGTKGEASSSNVPGAREDAVSWIDSQDNLWLFGGLGYAGGGSNFSHLNDLWVWDGTNWTWKSGSNIGNQPANYGTKGTPAPSNIPGAREDAVSWVDSKDILWLFGGLGIPDTTNNDYQLSFNDLWSWDGENWTWVAGGNSGDEIGIYGNKGEAAASNVPGARDDSITWVDSLDNLWLFGGYGVDSAGNWGDLNDLWRWDGTNWTWISGSEFIDSVGVYGTKGQSADINMPGAREDSIAWVDSNDYFWLFGGIGFDSTGSYFRLNDLWRWDGTNWTWISGSDTGRQIGSYGEKGIAAEGNRPGSRTDSIAWVDSEDVLWLFGGWGYDKFGSDYNQLNDLWQWNGTHWTWVSGSDVASQIGIYGNKGVGSSSNIPGARNDSVAWIDSNDNLWIFGGDGYDRGTSVGSLNDLWRTKRFDSAAQ